tara:strand:+ start:59 stop:1000 length:942 start_codon:yes stop_codon:yes gene_type:complete
MKQASKIIMRNFILLTSLSIISSCEQPFAKIKVTDEKSKIIEKIFQEVSAENTDYIEEAFSDEMKMVNPKKVEFDKTSFISGIKDMYDLFDNITFESSDGNADGSEIETNYYSNGKVWTSIWNNFSATGKYTGQQINIPFHISYQWEENKIIEEFQFYDMTAFENEATARNAQNNISPMSGEIVQNDEKSKTVTRFMKAYIDNNLSSVKNIFSESAIIQINDVDVSFDELNTGFSDGHNYFNDIAHSNVTVTTMYYNNGEVFTNSWYDWSGISKATNDTLNIRGYAYYKWEGDKIVKMHNAFDPTLYNQEFTR